MKLFVNGKEKGIEENTTVHQLNKVVYNPNRDVYWIVIWNEMEEVFTYFDLSDGNLIDESYNTLTEMDSENDNFVAVDAELSIIHRK